MDECDDTRVRRLANQPAVCRRSARTPHLERLRPEQRTGAHRKGRLVLREVCRTSAAGRTHGHRLATQQIGGELVLIHSALALAEGSSTRRRGAGTKHVPSAHTPKAGILLAQKRTQAETVDKHENVFFAISENEGKSSKGQLILRAGSTEAASMWDRVDHDLAEVLQGFQNSARTARKVVNRDGDNIREAILRTR